MSQTVIDGTSSVRIYVPAGFFSTDTFIYEEGSIVSFMYSDSSSISILCGADADLLLPEKRMEHLYYRKIVKKGYQLTFEQVSEERLRVFNLAFDRILKE